jgi:hypothetical protein
VATVASIRNGEKAKFWTSHWLDGICPNYIAPKIFKGSKRKNCNVRKTMEDNFWANQIDIREGIDMEHIQQFVTLWELVSNIHLEQVRQILLEVH